MKSKILNFLRYLVGVLEPKPEFIGSEPRMDTSSKAFYANQMLRNPIYREVMERIEAECIMHWKKSPDMEDRERLHVHWMVLRQINDYIRLYVSNQAVKIDREEPEEVAQTNS